MVHAARGTPNKVKDMVTYFEERRDQTAKTPPSRRRRSVAAMMNFTKRPWEHFPRRKSSSSTNHRRTSSTTSTGSDSTTYELAEEHLAESGYAASERSGTSTAVSDDRRRSANPDYDWEHDDITDLKERLNSISLWSPPLDSIVKGSETPNELQKVDSAGVEDKSSGTGTPGVHEIDFVDRSQTADNESRPGSSRERTLSHPETSNEVEVVHSETVNDGVDEGEHVIQTATLDSKASASSDITHQAVVVQIPPRQSSAPASSKVGQLRLKTVQLDKDRKNGESTSPNSPSPKSKTRPKLALDLPGIPESEAETLGRQRMSQMGMLGKLPSAPQAVHVNRSSRPPVSMRRYPVRSISMPLPSQLDPRPTTSPVQMSDLISQRQVKFTTMREEKRRLSSIRNLSGAAQRPGSAMGRRHASCPVGEAAPPRRRPSGYPAARPSLAQRFSLSRRKQSISQAFREYIRAPRRRPSFFLRRSRSVAAG